MYSFLCFLCIVILPKLLLARSLKNGQKKNLKGLNEFVLVSVIIIILICLICAQDGNRSSHPNVVLSYVTRNLFGGLKIILACVIFYIVHFLSG